MLAREDNERVTRVGPGTPMGETMRRYWIPAILGWELPEPDCPPVRVRLLGEDLVAFRDSRGRVGLLAERCPHRQASLYFGRNEGCGLRCVYHGWKFDADGQCVDMMNEPEELSFAQKIRTTAYPTVEMGGLVWAYLGAADRRPPLPCFAWTQAPPSHRHVSKVMQETNWLQGLEGGIDTSHAPILHRVLDPASSRPGFKVGDPFVRGKAPVLELDVTDYGYRYAGLRPLGENETHVRAYHFILPFHQIRPARIGESARGNSGASGHIWVPMDDETTMVYNWEHSVTDPLSDEERLERRLGNGPLDVDQTTFRGKRNRGNNYLLDRRVQKTETFTGIDGINVQDRAIQESMGAIVDRTKEHLGPADRAVIQARRLLLQATRTVEAGGTPPGVETSYYTLQPAEAVIQRDTDWRQLLAPDAPRTEALQQA
ncbi:MAG TPA: Rieske 2Fe-2S domain-containing protein [Methylomirabilota bacterium]|nr:Rieske 2Fe-2S domain-containing protein [Methylomirabilota bacterium]